MSVIEKPRTSELRTEVLTDNGEYNEFESVQLIEDDSGNVEAYVVTILVSARRLSGYALSVAVEADENGASPLTAVRNALRENLDYESEPLKGNGPRAQELAALALAETTVT